METIKLFRIVFFSLLIIFGIQPCQAQLAELRKEYDKVEDVYLGRRLWKVYKGNLQGLYDRDGKMVLPAKYQRISRHVDYVVLENENGLEGLFDKNFKSVLPFQYEDLRCVLTASDPVRKYWFMARDAAGEKYYFLDADGSKLSPKAFNWTPKIKLYDGVVVECDAGYNLKLKDLKGKLLTNKSLAGFVVNFSLLGPDKSRYLGVSRLIEGRFKFALLDLEADKLLTGFDYVFMGEFDNLKRERVNIFKVAKSEEDVNHGLFNIMKYDGSLLTEKKFDSCNLLQEKSERNKRFYHFKEENPTALAFLVDKDSQSFLLFPDYSMKALGEWKED
ncbi:MAG: WG repeat-containing protein [Bacteroidia bacterium]|nr:WG repeat-containing protein [Bacteroidia bacterium]